MRLTQASCPSCGGIIEISDNQSFATCTHCGSKIILDWTGQISLATYLELGMRYLCVLNFGQANKYFSKALEKEPSNQEAWFWKGIALISSGNLRSRPEGYAHISKTQLSEEYMSVLLMRWFNECDWVNIRQTITNIARPTNWNWSFNNNVIIPTVLSAYPESREDMALLLFQEAVDAYQKDQDFASWAIDYSIRLAPGSSNIKKEMEYFAYMIEYPFCEIRKYYIKRCFEKGFMDSVKSFLTPEEQSLGEELVFPPSEMLVQVYRSTEFINLATWPMNRFIPICMSNGCVLKPLVLKEGSLRERANLAKVIQSNGYFIDKR